VRYLHFRAWRLAAGLAAPLLLAGGLAGSAPAAAATAPCVSITGASPVALSTVDNTFTGVTEISSCDVWAAGFDIVSGQDQPLTEHWDGNSWTVIPSPGPSGSSSAVLEDVRAVSASDVWAVGSFVDSSGTQNTLAMNWNGSTWSVVPTPSPAGTFSQLKAVRAVSANNVWAVGSSFTNANGFSTLIEHWDGTAWTIKPSPPAAPNTSNLLNGLAVVSASNAWAVGSSSDATADHTLILHFNGTSWTRVANTPTPDDSDILRAVSATSASNAWAVGASSDNSKTLILRWNGTSWKPVASPSPTNDNDLRGVAATSTKNAWAVGFTATGTLILAWNGTSWARVPSPAGDQLNDVVATSALNAWAVGDTIGRGIRVPLAIHCC
jgi:hypothetical protein